MKTLSLSLAIIAIGGCSLTDVALDRVNESALLRYCEEVSSEQRTVLRDELAEACERVSGQPCGLAARCPGEPWALPQE